MENGFLLNAIKNKHKPHAQMEHIRQNPKWITTNKNERTTEKRNNNLLIPEFVNMHT